MDRTLCKGPWTFYGEPFFLKPWSRKFDFSKGEFKTVPTWVKLFGVPTTYWSHSGLSAIASKLGVPLYADEITSSANILEFARVCVDMKASSDFPHSFKVQTEHNETFEIRVEYGWKPKSYVRPPKPQTGLHPTTSSSGTKASAMVVPKHKLLPNATLSESSNSFLALSTMGEDAKDASGNVPCKALDPLVGNGSEEGEIIAEVDGVLVAEGGCLKGREVGTPSENIEQGGTGEGGAEGHVHSSLDEELELTINSDDGGEWTPIQWGKKRILVDEIDRRKFRKGKGKKGSRVS